MIDMGKKGKRYSPRFQFQVVLEVLKADRDALVLTSDNNRLYLLWRNGGTNSQRNTKTSHERPDYTDRRNGVLEKIRNSEREDGTAHMAIRLCLSRRRTRTYTGRY